LTGQAARAIASAMENMTVWLVGLAILLSLAVLLLVLRAQRQKRAQIAAAAEAADRAAAQAAKAAADMPSPFVSGPNGAGDDLRQIKGIGPKLETLLHTLGVFHYAQIAAWTPLQLAHVDARLGTFAGRPERDQWQSQARLLAAGDIKGYERAHGKLGGTSG
jgi:predicted flap endonuclease-1-like 5' DNA nuclease